MGHRPEKVAQAASEAANSTPVSTPPVGDELKLPRWRQGGQTRQDDPLAYLLDRLTPEKLQGLEPLLRIDLAPRRVP